MLDNVSSTRECQYRVHRIFNVAVWLLLSQRLVNPVLEKVYVEDTRCLQRSCGPNKPKSVVCNQGGLLTFHWCHLIQRCKWISTLQSPLDESGPTVRVGCEGELARTRFSLRFGVQFSAGSYEAHINRQPPSTAQPLRLHITQMVSAQPCA